MIFPTGALKINIQFNHKISAHVEHANPSCERIFISVFKSAQMILICSIGKIVPEQVNTE